MHPAWAHRFTPQPMMSIAMMSVGLLLGAMTLGTALAQTPPANASDPPAAPRERAIPPPEELEPAVDTTKGGATATPGPAAPAAPATRAPGAPRATAETSRGGGAAPAARTAAGAKSAAGAKTGVRKGPDRLELDPTDITGNRELPKVLYIVPWKRSDLGDLAGRPVNSLLDEVLQPLDRDVFQRENRYYDALKPGETASRQGAVQGSGDKR
jgi:hypothetical protein